MGSKKTVLLLILCFQVLISLAQTYYSKSTGNLHATSTWGTSIDGTGTSPANFTTSNCTYIISNRTTVSLTGNFTISGSNSKIILGNGNEVISFEIPSNYTVTTPAIDVQNNATLAIANTSIPTLGTLHTGSTIIFCSTGNQIIPAKTYYNLHTEIGGNKKLGGNTTVSNHLRIGAITTLRPSTHTLTLSGEGDVITYIGTFLPDTSTVIYSSLNNVIVKALNYNNLNISGGPRTLEPKNIIGIKGIFTPGSGPFTITNSTVEYNNTSAQNISAFTYYNLQINSTSSLTTSGGASIVSNKLTFLKGKITTSPANTLTVTNPNHDAVSYGSGSSYIIGAFTRYIKANLNNTIDKYVFPVGNASNYYEFLLSNISTGSGNAIVSVFYNTSNEWATSISSGTISLTSISVSQPSTPASNSSIVYSSTLNGTTTNIFGTVSGNSIINSERHAIQNFYKVSTRTITPETYVYCSGNVHEPSSWKLTNCSGATLTSFSGNDRTYTINNANVTLTSNLSITGHNVTLNIGTGSITSVTINSGVLLSVTGNLNMQQSSTITNNGTIIISGNLSYSNVAYQKYIDINNNGTLTIYGKLSQNQGTFSRINNNSLGIINLFGDYYKDQNTWFYNSGLFNITNAEMKLNSNSETIFENRSGGTVNINNTANRLKNIILYGLNLTENFLLRAGSQFNILNANMLIENAHGTLTVAGLLYIEDGNLDYVSGGATITVPAGGEIYIFDTDNNKDGVLDLSNGGITLNVYGEAYIEGLTVNNGGGSQIHVRDGGEMFIGNVGLYTGLNNNEITVYSGGILYYCGNKTPVNENMGTIQNGGTLNYANGYYTTQTPGSQGDFIIQPTGTQTAAFANNEVCRDAFYNGIPEAFEFLPIELTMLYATCTNGKIDIIWQTASETNNHFFTIYRSYDGVLFEPISEIAGRGTIAFLQNYSYSDEPLFKGIVYYKLAQTDFDGTTSYSKIITVATCTSEKSIFSFFGSSVEIDFATERNQVIIIDLQGKILYSQLFTQEETARIMLPQAKGMYIISVITPFAIQSEKFIR